VAAHRAGEPIGPCDFDVSGSGIGVAQIAGRVPTKGLRVSKSQTSQPADNPIRRSRAHGIIGRSRIGVVDGVAGARGPVKKVHSTRGFVKQFAWTTDEGSVFASSRMPIARYGIRNKPAVSSPNRAIF